MKTHDEDRVLTAELLAEAEDGVVPGHFADRVTAQVIGRTPDKSRQAARKPWLGYAYAVAALALLGLLLSRTLTLPTIGEVRAAHRRQVPLGSRAIAVAENESAFRFEIDAWGNARVKQETGNVFYRVNPGGAFVVETPSGRVTVRGTCFRVEIVDMKTAVRMVGSGLLGASAAAAVVVTVYEGKVALANSDGSVEASAGERAAMVENLAPIELRPVAGENSNEQAQATSTAYPSERLPPRPHAQETQAWIDYSDALETRLAEERARLASAAEQLRVLRAQNDARSQNAEPTTYYPVAQDQLLGMTERCEINVDAPPVLGLTATPLGAEAIESLGLSEPEIRVFNDAILRTHRHLLETLREAYVEATGDERTAATLSPRAILEELEEKAPGGEASRIRLQIAREKAGLVPVASNAEPTPLERAQRLLANSGDEFQHLIAQTLGPERAHELRSMKGGWPFHRIGRSGCPD